MGTDTATEPKLKVGGMVPLFVLPSTAGGKTGPGAYRSRYNLVLAFLGRGNGADAESYLLSLCTLNADIQAEQGRVTVVVGLPIDEAKVLRSRLQLPFPLLADEDLQVTGRMLGGEKFGLCVADRFGEAISVEVAQSISELPPASGALDWLIFIQAQCPE